MKNAWFAGPILLRDDMVLREMRRRTGQKRQETGEAYLNRMSSFFLAAPLAPHLAPAPPRSPRRYWRRGSDPSGGNEEEGRTGEGRGLDESAYIGRRERGPLVRRKKKRNANTRQLPVRRRHGHPQKLRTCCSGGLSAMTVFLVSKQTAI